MASKFLTKRSIPDGFKEILSNLTREILREQPTDIFHFSAAYFEHLSQGKTPQQFVYDKDHVILNPQSKLNYSRSATSNSHKSEKILSKEYMNQLYEYGMEKTEELDKDYENQGNILGELYINIVSARNLNSKESCEETYCVAFLTSDPLKIMKTAIASEAFNPQWDHQDKLVIRNLGENDFFETNLIFQVFTNDNGAVMVGEASVDLDFAVKNPGEWELKLTNGEGVDSGLLNLQVNFLKESEANGEGDDGGERERERNESEGEGNGDESQSEEN